jgi:hypothetical protein
MIKILCAVKDTISETFTDPRAEINEASAKRAFKMGLEEAKNKDDYALYQIGAFDTESGQIMAIEPVRIMSGHDIKPKISSITPEMQRADLEKVQAIK